MSTLRKHALGRRTWGTHQMLVSGHKFTDAEINAGSTFHMQLQCAILTQVQVPAFVRRVPELPRWDELRNTKIAHGLAAFGGSEVFTVQLARFAEPLSKQGNLERHHRDFVSQEVNHRRAIPTLTRPVPASPASA